MGEAQVFRYQALTAAREPVHGELRAEHAQAAVAQLQARGLLVLQVQPASRAGLLRRGRTRRSLAGAALASFTQQLATLLGAGQPLERALGTLARQLPGAPARALVERVREQVKGGKPLSQALEEEGGQFAALYLSMVRAGEAGGTLAHTLAQLGDYLERSHALRGEVTNALIYPAFLVVGVLGSLALLMAYVVPQFVPIFRDLGVPVPLITQAIMATGEVLQAWGLSLLAVLALLLWGSAGALRDPVRRLRRDRWLLRLKVAGPLLQRIETARLARTLGTLLSNGVALLPALAIARQVCANQALGAQVGQAIEWVKGGGTLASAFGPQPLLPELALQMIEVGEQAGALGSLLLKAAEVFDRDAKRGIDRLLAALVPTLTVVMAVLVAVIMLAIMLPLMSLTSNL